MYNPSVRIHLNVKLSDLTANHPQVLTVLERMDIAFGFGEQSISSIARNKNIDPEAFLDILRVTCGERFTRAPLNKKGIAVLLRFLTISHLHFFERQIPDLRNLLLFFSEGLPVKNGSLIVSFFDEYIKELSEHLKYEEEVVFPYIQALLAEDSFPSQTISEQYTTPIFQQNYSDIKHKLHDLKNILIKYLPEEGNTEYRRKILKELSTLETDINIHNYIEEFVLIPSIRNIEEEIKI